MAEKQKILIIEDEEDIQELIEYNLLKQGYVVEVRGDGEQGIECAKSFLPDLILLDIMLPGLDGLSVCREIRMERQLDMTPIIMLTAKSEETDIVVGLELGADDYMTKPFSPNELVARIRAHLRRKRKVVETSVTEKKDSAEDEVVEFKSLKINKDQHVIYIRGEKQKFTLAEFKIILALASSPGKVFTRDQLIEIIAGEDTYLVGRNIDVHIRSIRKKLGDDASMVETIRGVGYKCQS